MCTCRGCWLLFTPRAPAAATSRRCPTATLAFPDAPLVAGAVGRLQIPVSVAFFFVNSTLDRVAAFYPEPGRARPSRCCRSTRGTRSSARNPALADARSPTSRRSSCASTAGPARRRVLPRADRRVLRARRPAAHAVARLRRRHARRTTRSTRSSTTCGRRPDERRSRFEVLDARPEPYAAVPTIMLRLRITESTGPPVHAVALRCQIRIEPQRRRYDPDEEDRLVEVFGEPPQWGQSLQPFLWTHVATTVTGFTGRPRSTCRSPAPTTSRSRATKYLPLARRRRDPARAAVLRHRVHPRRRRLRRSQPVAWHEEASFRLAGRRLARHDGPLLPELAAGSR